MLQWYEQSLRALCSVPTGQCIPHASSPAFLTALLQIDGCCPSVRLVRTFFDYLNARMQESIATISPARLLLDAFVHSMHGMRRGVALDGTKDWIMSTSHFPFLIRMTLELSLQRIRSTGDADPSWPPYLLMLVGRDDLCG